MELLLVTSRKNASIFPAGVYEISIFPPRFPINAHACARVLGARMEPPGRSVGTIVTNFKEEVSFYDIEPFILMRMNMSRKSTPFGGYRAR